MLVMTALCGLMMMSAGCQSTERRLESAAATKGRVSAGVVLAPLPDDCRKHMGRVLPKVGEKVRWTQKRWEYSADAVDRQIDDCTAFWDDQRSRMQSK